MDKLRLIMDCDCTMGVPGCDVDDSLALPGGRAAGSNLLLRK